MLFSFSKLAWSFVSPGNALVLALVMGLLCEKTATGWCRIGGRRLVFFSATCFLLLTLFPIGQWALTPLENRFPLNLPTRADGIIVLGGDEQAFLSENRDMPIALDSMRRLVTFSEMAKKFPTAKLFYSGGSAFPHKDIQMTESDVARNIMEEIGLSTTRVIFERNSRNTYENALFSADILKPVASQNWLLVTSAWHMPRAMACYEKAGFRVFAIPTGYFTSNNYHTHFTLNFDDQLHLLSLAAHEYFGLLAYWLLDRTDALWPS